MDTQTPTLVLGIETTCDETAAAVVERLPDGSGRILSNVVRSQIDEHAPAAVKEALDKKELSINQGYQITKQVEDLPEEQREQAAQEALDILRAKKEIQEKDAEIDREGKIAGVFCKAYEKAVLLDPTEENVRIWAKCTRMTRDEMEDTVKESRELAEVFRTIADLMERLLPERGTL